jgi:hypothetical protein
MEAGREFVVFVPPLDRFDPVIFSASLVVLLGLQMLKEKWLIRFTLKENSPSPVEMIHCTSWTVPWSTYIWDWEKEDQPAWFTEKIEMEGLQVFHDNQYDQKV